MCIVCVVWGVMLKGDGGVLYVFVSCVCVCVWRGVMWGVVLCGAWCCVGRGAVWGVVLCVTWCCVGRGVVWDVVLSCLPSESDAAKVKYWRDNLPSLSCLLLPRVCMCLCACMCICRCV